MGFMDKAKKLAEQAQQKLDEAQNQFNQGGSTQPQGEGGGVRYDSHGRPIEQPPAADTPPPAAAPTPPPADPTAGFPAAPSAPDPAAPPDPAAEQQEEPRGEQSPPAPSGGADASPDPFKPLQ